jgi:4-hydroxybenzoate polyprenyltransferase
MDKLKAWLRLIRAGNLTLILFTMVVIRFFVMAPMIEVMNLNLVLPFSVAEFALLCLSVMLISAAGYIINDYFDYHIDHVNRPSTVVVGHAISRRQAMLAHSVMNVAGTGIGFILAYKVGLVNLGFIHLFTTGMLWFYSTDFKKRFLIGNVIISALTALVPLVVPLFELPLFIEENRDILTELNLQVTYILKFIAGFALFAFLISLIREITKDLEDAAGDEEFGCVTLPIAWGEQKTRMTLALLTLITMSGLAYVQWMQYQSQDYYSLGYFSLFVQTPLLFFLLRLFNHGTPKYYHTSSRLLKLIMLAGICYSFLYSWLLLQS